MELLKISASVGRGGVERRERSAIARIKIEIGPRVKFAAKEIGVTIQEYPGTSGNDPTHAARETPVARQTHSKATCIRSRGPRNRLRGRKGSGAVQRCKNSANGSANNIMAPTTAKES